jgi:hypothetical protein
MVWKVGETGQRRQKDMGSMVWRGHRTKGVEGCRMQEVEGHRVDSVQRRQDKGATVCRGGEMREAVVSHPRAWRWGILPMNLAPRETRSNLIWEQFMVALDAGWMRVGHSKEQDVANLLQVM